MARAYVSIGSNVEREKNVGEAIRALGERFEALAVSSVYESPAVGFEGNPFYNLVVGFDTDLRPTALVEELKRLEAKQGRGPAHRGMRSRSLDLDLLLWDSLVEPDLGLPAEDILRYSFVLVPMAEIAGQLLHPVLGAPLAKLCAGMTLGPPLRRVHLDLEQS